MPHIAIETLTRWLTHDAVNTAEHVGQERYWLAWLADNPRICYRGATEQAAVHALQRDRNFLYARNGFLTPEEKQWLAEEMDLLEMLEAH